MKRRKAIIVDIDGTLADARHRLHLIQNAEGTVNWPAWDALCHKDTPFAWCVGIVTAMHRAGYKIIFLTGRGERIREATQKWLTDNLPVTVVQTSILLMRKNGDHRKDIVIKEEYYRNEIEPKYEVAFAIDDRDAVVEMFRGLGLTVLHCDKWTEEMERQAHNLIDPKHKSG